MKPRDIRCLKSIIKLLDVARDEAEHYTLPDTTRNICSAIISLQQAIGKTDDKPQAGK
jgi:hypothetical protein